MNLTVNGNVTSVAVHSTRTCVVGTHDMCIGAGGYNSATGVGNSADGFGTLSVSRPGNDPPAPCLPSPPLFICPAGHLLLSLLAGLPCRS